PVLIETFVLLTSSFMIGLAVNAMRLGHKKAMMSFLVVTLVLGAISIGFEITEFIHDVDGGAGLSTSAFTSALLTTLGTHGAHFPLLLVWRIATLLLAQQHGVTPKPANKSFIFSLYWHFLEVVWIFIVSFIYLKG